MLSEEKELLISLIEEKWTDYDEILSYYKKSDPEKYNALSSCLNAFKLKDSEGINFDSTKFSKSWLDISGITLMESLLLCNKPDVFKKFISNAKLTVGMKPTLEKKYGEYSYFGGDPTVTEDFIWPHIEEKGPLGFRCQIDVSDLKNFIVSEKLPTKGIISVFVYADWEEDMVMYWDGQGCEIFYFEAIGKECDSVPEFNEEGNESSRLYYISFKETLDFPSYDSAFLSKELMNEIDCETYYEIVNSHLDITYSRLFGFAHPKHCDVRNFTGENFITLESEELLYWSWKDAHTFHIELAENDLLNLDFTKIFYSDG